MSVNSRVAGRPDLGAENHGVKPFEFPVLTEKNIGPEAFARLARPQVTGRAQL
jgi:hypothetical protein